MLSKLRTFLQGTIPLRTVIIVPVVLLILATVGLTTFLSYINGIQAVEEIAARLREQIAVQIEQHIVNFLDTPRRIDLTNRDLIEHGLLDPTNPVMLQQHFLSQVQLNPTITSIYFGTPQGGIAGAGREGPGGSFYVYATDEFKPGIFRKFSADPSGKQGGLVTKVDNFDARTRVWYQKAAASSAVSLSDVYILSTGQDMAIATSLPVYDSSGAFAGVISVDLFLSHLNSFLNSLVISPSGQSFIIQSNGLVVANSVNEPTLFASPNDGKMQRLSVQNSQDPLIRAAAQHILTEGGEHAQMLPISRDFTFELNGATQYALVRPLKDKIGLEWYIVVIIPQDDLMGKISEASNTNLLISLGATLLAVLVSVLVAQRITYRIHHLAENAHALAGGSWDEIQVGSSRIREISQLTEAYNLMVRRLRQSLDNLVVEINERKQVEETLRISEQRYTQLFIEAKVRAEELSVIDQVGRMAVSTMNFDQMLERLSEYCMKVLDVSVFYVATYDAKSHTIHHPLFIDEGERAYVPPRNARLQPGLTGYVINTAKTLYISDTSLPEVAERYQIIHTSGKFAASYVGVPMIVRGRVVGVLSIQSYEANAYRPESIHLLEMIADRVAAAVEQSQLFAQIQANARFLEGLNDITRASLEAVDLQAVLLVLSQRLNHLFDADTCYITRWDEDEQRVLPIVASYDINGQYPTKIFDPEEKTVTQAVLELGKPIAIPDVSSTPYLSPLIASQFSSKSLLGLPLIAGDHKFGAALIGFDNPHEFSEQEMVMGSLVSNQIALAIAKSELVVIDPLTNLMNRRGLISMGNREIDRSKRYFTNLSVIFCDLDHFKSINDRYGHDAGDQVLKITAQRIRKNVRLFDIIGRYGGEEFVILLPETAIEDATILAQRLCDALSKTPIHTDHGPIEITVSIGVSSLNQRIQNLESLLRAADESMYAAKMAGRNQVKVTFD